MNKLWIYPLIAVIVAILSACSMRPGMSPSGKAGSAYTEFFVQPGVMQYFTGPYYFDSKTTQVQVDFTLRDSTHSTSEVAMNFTIISQERIKSPESFLIENESKEEVVLDVKSEIKPFYSEQDKKGMIIHRFGSFIDYESFKKFVESNEELSATIQAQDWSVEAKETRQSRKMRTKVEESVVQKIEFNQAE